MRRVATVVSMCALVTLVLLAPSPFATAEDETQAKVVAIEKALWEGWKNKDAKPFEEHVTDDNFSINPLGLTAGKANQIKMIAGSDCDVKGYSLSDIKTYSLGKDAVLLSYKATQDAICGGMKIPPTILVTSTYVNQDGAWKAASYHESPLLGAE